MAEAQSFWQEVAAIGVIASILDEAGQDCTPSTAGRTAAALQANRNEYSVTIGPTWVMWNEQGVQDWATNEEIIQARRVLWGCQSIVDDERSITPLADRDDVDEIARFTDWLASMVDVTAYTSLTNGRADVTAITALTEFGLYMALVQQGRVYAAIRCL